MLGQISKLGRTAVAAALALGLASSTVFASGAPWDSNYALFGESGVCEQNKVKVDDAVQNCQHGSKGAICDYVVGIGNTTKYPAYYAINIGQLPPTWRLYASGLHYQGSLRPWQWETVKLFRTSVDRPSPPVLVSFECLLSR